MESLYQQLAGEIAGHIASGVYATGERLPGVRGLARTRGVSVATAIAAYQALADTGQIEARARSGFYVRVRQAIQPIEPDPAAGATAPRIVTGQAMAMALIKAANDPGMAGGELVPAALALRSRHGGAHGHACRHTRDAAQAGAGIGVGAARLARLSTGGRT